jgi:C-terminal processing protease CtpA/Prc
MVDSERLAAENAARHERMLTQAKVQAAVRLEAATKKILANMMSSRETGMAPRRAVAQRSAPPVRAIADKPREVPTFHLPPPPEAPKRKVKVYDLKAGGADVGIKYSPHAKGLVVRGFIKKSEAANSGLMVGDLIYQVGESFLAGLPALECYMLMSGTMGSLVVLTVTRDVNGVQKRVVIDVMCDVPAPPKKAALGFDFKLDAAGVRVKKVYEGTSAFEHLQKGDLITEIDEEFIAGLPLSETKELMSGPARCNVHLGFTRVDSEKCIKRRGSADLIFDHKPRPAPLAEYSSMGDVGIEYATTALGLKVTGFQKLSSAASSGLQIGDIITQVGDELIIGLPGALVRALAS